MDIAVIRTGGKQYIVSPGKKLKIEKLENKEGSEISFRDILLVEKNGKTQVGKPLVKDASVSAKIAKQGRSPKAIVFKYKPKKRFRKKKGHRQPYTEVEILAIKFGGVSSAKRKTSVTKR